jgi:hypothetical protein
MLAAPLPPPTAVELIVIVLVEVQAEMAILLPAANDNVSVFDVAKIKELFALIVAKEFVVAPLEIKVITFAAFL